MVCVVVRLTVGGVVLVVGVVVLCVLVGVVVFVVDVAAVVVVVVVVGAVLVAVVVGVVVVTASPGREQLGVIRAGAQGGAAAPAQSARGSARLGVPLVVGLSAQRVARQAATSTPSNLRSRV